MRGDEAVPDPVATASAPAGLEAYGAGTRAADAAPAAPPHGRSDVEIAPGETAITSVTWFIAADSRGGRRPGRWLAP